LSITASTPTRSAPTRATGTPPPPQATTTSPASSRRRISPASTTSTGSGDATTRRQPRPESSATDQPRAEASRRARPSEKNGPIGLVGRANAGSSASTTTWVITAATDRGIPRVASVSPIACASR
jgi:hypothetical protein